MKNDLFNIVKSDQDFVKPLIEAIFEKACIEKEYVGMYAEMCKFLANSYLDFQLENNPDSVKRTQDSTFRKLLLATFQERFEITFEGDNNQITDPLILHKGFGNCSFIGKLFQIGFMPPKVVFTCVMNLISPDLIETYKNPDLDSLRLDEKKLEGAIILLKNSGIALETENFISRTNSVFSVLAGIAEKSLSSPRIKSLILDLLDLRSSGWKEGAQTLPKLISN